MFFGGKAIKGTLKVSVLGPIHTDFLAIAMPQKWVEYPFLSMNGPLQVGPI